MEITITCRFDGSVLFKHDAENNTTRITLEAAIKVGANLCGAYLDGAYLDGANLRGANLRGANLRGANLDGANLGGANLDGANLDGANLDGANLRGAYLDGAYLCGAYLRGAYLCGGERLVGERPIFQIGTIGSRCAYFVAYLTDKGLRLRAGCFFGGIKEFKDKLASTHGDNKHADEYGAALALIEKHAELWAPKVAEVEREQATI